MNAEIVLADRVLVVRYGKVVAGHHAQRRLLGSRRVRPTFDEAVVSGHEAFAKMMSERRKGQPSKQDREAIASTNH